MISCELTGPELQKRKTEIIALLKTEVLQRKELENGYRYSFKGFDTIIDNVISFIKSERACCDFLTFNLSIEDVNRNVVLTITGPEGAKEFISREMDL